jgi:predicted nucleic acid-binding protein
VTAFIDTNVLVRHLTGDPPDQAERATRYLASAGPLFLADLILAEVAYVLESYYEVARPDVARALRSIVDFPAIRVIDAALLFRAIELNETERLDFDEAYLVACAEATGVGVVASFDRSIDRVGTVRRDEPA